MSKKKVYEVNERVFAKVRGFPAWPARITAVIGNRYKVFFYGTYETATLKKDEIWEYNDATKTRFGKGNQKRKGFTEGMYEIENVPDLQPADETNKPTEPHDPVTTEGDGGGGGGGGEGKGGGEGGGGGKENKESEIVGDTSDAKETTSEEKETKEEQEVQEEEEKGSEENVTVEETPVTSSENVDSTKEEEKSAETSMEVEESGETVEDETTSSDVVSQPMNGESSESVSSSETKTETKTETTTPQPTTASSTSEKKDAVETPEVDADENALIINESTPKNTRSNRKRKAEDTPIAPPPTKKRAGPSSNNVTPNNNNNSSSASGDATNTPTTVSRSGRIIKPKKFVDDEDNLKSETPKSTKVNSGNNSNNVSAAKKEPRKMWVEVKSTGDMIEINLDQDKPSSFDSKDAELQWERATARNALKFKERVESGDFIPDEVRVKLEEKLNRTEEEERILKRARQISLKMEKIRWLKIEQRLVDIDIELKTSCNVSKPDVDKCVRTLNELDTMVVAPLMLKKQPDIVTTIRKLRRYVGPKDIVSEVEAEKVRNKADRVYSKLKSVFNVPEGTTFDDAFREELADFENATKSMESQKVVMLVTDPTKKPKGGKNK